MAQSCLIWTESWWTRRLPYSVFGHAGPRSTRSIPSKQRGWDMAGPISTPSGKLLPHADHEAESREVERLEIEDVAGVIPLPGVLQLLGTLPLERWAIVTSCTRPLAEVRIRAASLPNPKHLVTSSDVARGKPAPDPYVKGVELLNLASQDCIVIEDAPSGIRSGKAAGARVLALLTTIEYELLASAGADWIARDCAAIAVERNSRNTRIVLNCNVAPCPAVG